MTDQDGISDVDRFVKERIDTVPHLEALLLLWNSRPKPWSVESMGQALYLAPESAREILEDLVRQGLIVISPAAMPIYRCEPEPSLDRLLAAVDSAYRHELIRITRLIHSKPSAAVRAFATAFRIMKERK
ncbi:MAG TPA: hypothetical protein VKU01_22725 [Bryobacteraceae bacterium]|nr:hypothetical protein [Bryobacteraceae bacterium]